MQDMRFQTLAQPTGPIHVIVDHIPIPPGLPVWETALLSAGIGALFGILTGTLMEIVKPMLARFLLMRKMGPQLIAELRQNLKGIIDAKRAESDSQSDEEIVVLAEYLINSVDLSRFAYYLENQPLSVYEFDEDKFLQRFNNIYKSDLPDYVSMRKAGEISAIVISRSIEESAVLGLGFLSSHGLKDQALEDSAKRSFGPPSNS